ncbi:hypothetical protein [Zavarzinia compransoris]|uniref:Elongation factor P hydroxylase n=1 Tax=Zavarzinia compransoris TaxID=1264899 RepID=A0A317ECX5_9PROT|nr:hypothetical protein [Zavarzinia compransoris]PWR23990.1 hypothetical protein DKG75_05465 [Zavarzinia compransoris]TDP48249.1 hypothetical protein DES42_102552 [Zavarzinia compransoris]
MILTPVDLGELPALAATFDALLVAEAPWARAAFALIADSARFTAAGVDTPEQRAAAVALAESFGMAVLDEEPQAAFSWDGRILRTRSEASVIVHEVTHFLVAPPERRHVIDFGLGAGPESGRIEEANAATCADFATREQEETLASLLGVLWEIELGQPGILAFLEQNWLEGCHRPTAARHFARFLGLLVAAGLATPEGKVLRPAPGSLAA